MSSASKIIQAAAGVGGEPEGAWDLSYAYYNPSESAEWNVSTAIYTGVRAYVVSQDGAPNSIFFKPDGTKMYMLGASNDSVFEYDLSTPWDITTESYSKAYSVLVNGGVSNPLGLFFKPDGTKMFVCDPTSFTGVYSYDLSTAWDIGSATYDTVHSFGNSTLVCHGIYFRYDGLKVYLANYGTQTITEYDLSVAWDITSETLTNTLSVSAQSPQPKDVFFKPDGTKMFVLSDGGNDVSEYDLSTAWDISSASFVHDSLTDEDSSPSGMFFKPDGSILYTIGVSADYVHQYVVGGFDVNPEGGNPKGIFFKQDGLRMYVAGTTRDAISEYTLTTAFDTSTATYTREGSTGVNTAGIFFKPDGTRVFAVDQTNDEIRQYDLSAAWDISSMSKTDDFSVSAQEGTPEDLYFKDDGTTMFLVGSSGDNVYEYSLGTAWSVSTASFVQSFSVSSQETSASGLFFKSDGTKMYVSGGHAESIFEYDLSTEWDVSSAVYSQSFTIPSENGDVESLWFNEEGTLMFTVMSGINASFEPVFTYSLGVQE